MWHMGFPFPNQGSKLYPLHWEWGVLTGPPGKFPPPSSTLIEVLVGQDTCLLPEWWWLYSSLTAARSVHLTKLWTMRWQWNSPVTVSGTASQEKIVWWPCLVLFIPSAAHNRIAAILDYGDKFYTEKAEGWELSSHIRPGLHMREK